MGCRVGMGRSRRLLAVQATALLNLLNKPIESQTGLEPPVDWSGGVGSRLIRSSSGPAIAPLKQLQLRSRRAFSGKPVFLLSGTFII